MLAPAWLAVTRAALADDDGRLVTSANEIRRMFTALCSRPPRRAARSLLVTMAAPPPGTRTPLPLPATQKQDH